MEIFVTSDTHFYHKNIIKYCNRPFDSVEEMNRTLVEAWNGVVGKDDKVYHLGDFAFTNIELMKHVFSQLNGMIYLVKGNHDTRANSVYREIGFKEVYDKPILIEDYFILGHIPPIIFPEDSPYAFIYGHVHNEPLYQDYTKRTLCACTERWNYTPINLTYAAELMRGKEEYGE